MICGYLVWSDSLRTAAAVVIMYRFTAVPHVLLTNKFTVYSSKTPDERGRALCSLFLCFFHFFFIFLFWVGEWINWCLSTVLFTGSVGLQTSGFEPYLFPLFVLFLALFLVLFVWMDEGG